jgi:hypothetical protein
MGKLLVVARGLLLLPARITSSTLARGDGSAEALRSFVPERIPDPLSHDLSHAT